MTCREKLQLEHPEFVADFYDAGCNGCPHDYGYLPIPDGCGSGDWDGITCAACWDREIPETENNNNKKEKKIMANSKMTKAELLKEIEAANEHIQQMETQLKNLEKYKQYEDMANEMKALHTAFMNSGFSDEQAFDMLKMLIGPTVSSALRGMRL